MLIPGPKQLQQKAQYIIFLSELKTTVEKYKAQIKANQNITLKWIRKRKEKIVIISVYKLKATHSVKPHTVWNIE